MQLTDADRRALLDSFCTLAAEWDGADADLIVWATEWAASLTPTFGFELGLTRDVFVLCQTLRRSAGGEAAGLARGGLAYLYRNNYVDPLSIGPLGLLDDAFVAGYAAHAVREKTGEAPSYHPPRLGPDEQAKAESMFLDLLDSPDDQDDVLPELAGIALAKLGSLLESGLFRRLRTNVRFLTHVLGDRGRSKDHRQIARAALHYVAEENDAIPDSLGLIGFLDDYFVADLAVGLIDPGQAPWANLIDAVVGAWPFLNMVSFGDGQRGAAASEFLMVNTALTCPTIRGSESRSLTHLVLPRTGPLPLLLAFFASLGEVASGRRRVGSSMPFQFGQKVLVDGEAVRTFEGCRERDGRLEFGLGTTYRDRGQILPRVVYLPIDQLNRIVPADQERKTRGQITTSADRKRPLGPLDFLFLAADPVTVPPDLPQVVVVTPVRQAKRTSETVTLFGHRLCDIVPMGSLSTSGDISHWSAGFGATRPAVLIVPDLDRACEYVEGEGDRVALTVVDASGHNAGRLAALSRLQGLGARTLVAVGQADADSALVDDAGAVVWEWDHTDFEAVYVDPVTTWEEVDPVRAYEREVVRAVSASVDVVSVHCAEADNAFRSVSALRRLVEARGEDVPQELENALDRSFAVLTRLLRCPFRLSSHPRLAADLAARLDALAGCCSSGVFLSEEEKAAVDEVERQLGILLSVLRERNPKEEALTALRAADHDLAVACGETDLLDGAEALNAKPITSVVDQPEEYSGVGHVVAGWFGRGTMTRLLRPPFCTPLHVLLYGPEATWQRAFTRKVREGTVRRTRTARGRVFPTVGNWPDSAVGPPDQTDGGATTAGGENQDPTETYVVSARRNRLASLAAPAHGEEAVEARLVTFDGGHAFLTDDYQAKVASHLLDDSADGGDAELEVVPARRLRRGDVLLFLRGSDRDVIRQVADQMLPPGERERAGLWRRALLDYRRQRDCPVEVVWRRLREHGCPLSLATIENWFENENLISPANVDREVGAILALTQDPSLKTGLDACRLAISRVRGAHVKASNQLAKRVIERAVAELKSAGMGGGAIDLGEGIVLARVTDIDDTPVRVRASAVNRLVEDDSWLA